MFLKCDHFNQIDSGKATILNTAIGMACYSRPTPVFLLFEKWPYAAQKAPNSRPCDSVLVAPKWRPSDDQVTSKWTQVTLNWHPSDTQVTPKWLGGGWMGSAEGQDGYKGSWRS